jgi:hypothetical protein
VPKPRAVDGYSVCEIGSVDCVEMAEVSNPAATGKLEAVASLGSVVWCEIGETPREGGIVLWMTGATGLVPCDEKADSPRNGGTTCRGSVV